MEIPSQGVPSTMWCHAEISRYRRTLGLGKGRTKISMATANLEVLRSTNVQYFHVSLILVVMNINLTASMIISVRPTNQ